MRMLSIAAAALCLSTFALGCSAPADDDASASSSEAALSSRSSVRTDYRGTFDVSGDTFAIEVSVSMPSSLQTTQTVRGSQIMSDSPNCDAYIESFRANVTLKVKNSKGAIVAERSEQSWVNTQALLDDSVCPQGLLTTRRAVDSLDLESTMEGVSITANGKSFDVPFGYGSMGFVQLAGKVSFQASGRSQYEGERLSDRGHSTLTTRGTARFDMADTVQMFVAPSFDDIRDLELQRVR